MANQLITPLWVLKRTGRKAINNLRFANNVDRTYDDEFVQAGAKVGDTINLRLPWRATISKGQAFQQQAAQDQIVPVTLTDQVHGDLSFSSFQMTVDVDEYTDRYIDPIAIQIANTIDFDGLTRVYKEVYNAVGTPGTPITANATYLAANTLLSNLAAPPVRTVITSADMQAAITNANFALFNPQKLISDSFETGLYANDALGFSKWFWDQNVANSTAGTWTGTPLINGANQTGSSLVIDGWGAGSTLNRGDILYLGAASGGAASTGVFSINPVNYQANRQLEGFVVQANVTAVAGSMTVSVSPSIVTAGNLQSVSGSPVDNAVVTLVASGAQGQEGLSWVKEAVVMVMADLIMPEGGAIAERIRSKPLGFALRFAKQWSILSDQNMARVDGIYGWKTYRPEWVVRLRG